MKTILIFLFSLTTLLSKLLTVQLLYVYDGDTIKVAYDDKIERIRLIDIDTPESDQPFGDSSKIYLQQFLEGKKLQIDIEKKDQYGRQLATLYADGQNVNLWLVRNGYAWAYKYTRDQRIIHCAAEARRKNLGLWKYEAIDPYQWRKSK